MGNNYFLLQTENTDPLIKAVDKLNRQVSDNDKSISKLLQTSDKLTFPKFDPPVTNSKESSQERFDELRYHLDTKYKLLDLKSPEFQCANPRILQLLSDNYKLLVLYKMKQQYNRELAKVLRRYQQVLTVDLIPSLGNYNYNQSSKTFSQFGQIVENKLAHDQLVYDHYVYYTQFLQKFYDLLHKLIDLLNSMDLNFPELETKLIALNGLIDHVTSKSLIST